MTKMADQLSCLVCLLVTLLFDFSGIKGHRLRRLEPEKPLLNQVLHHKETVLYHLVNLLPGRSYELRISYPATTPTDFHINLVSEVSLTGLQTRKLLNTDKLVFHNDKAVTEQFANVTAIRTGVPYDPVRLSDPVVYNIVLEELTFGIPQHAWRLVLVVLITAFLTIKYLVPRFLSSLHEHANLKTHEKRNS